MNRAGCIKYLSRSGESTIDDDRPGQVNARNYKVYPSISLIYLLSAPKSLFIMKKLTTAETSTLTGGGVSIN